MTAPTEAEIRQAIEARLDQLFGGNEFSIDDNPAHELLAPLWDSDQALSRAGWAHDFHPADDHPGTLWADMRPSEVGELHQGLSRIIEEEEVAFAERVIDRAVAIGAAFAAAHPDLPRGHWPLPKADAPRAGSAS